MSGPLVHKISKKQKKFIEITTLTFLIFDEQMRSQDIFILDILSPHSLSVLPEVIQNVIVLSPMSIQSFTRVLRGVTVSCLPNIVPGTEFTGRCKDHIPCFAVTPSCRNRNTTVCNRGWATHQPAGLALGASPSRFRDWRSRSQCQGTPFESAVLDSWG